ncbi:hypothetical protein HY256_11250 [Candidatus Sumerlaeota bacterium]|nr:hypothetical protein [Candidatus Sumerlaeota bacterium]
MQDPPAIAELTGAVREFLQSKEAAADSPRRDFLMRVAANVLGIVERELQLGPSADAAERMRIAALLGREGTLDELNRALCKEIRAGAIGANHPELMAHLRATTLAKLAIDQPKYSGYLAARARKNSA